MPSGLIALLDDVATIAKIAAASVDDLGAATAKAGSKAAGVVIDDTAVTPRYVTGFTPDRELPIIGKIAIGSIRNKLLILLPAALLLSALLPMLIMPLLMIGASYLVFEATEKILEKVSGDHHRAEDLIDTAMSPQELEKLQVAGAVRTDFILSAEIMAIALAELESSSFGMQAAALAVVAIVITIAVYGVVGLIVKLDDIGLHLAQRGNAAARAIGGGLVRVVPKLLTGLSGIGTLAMLWVGGGILVHGLEVLGFLTFVPHLIHGIAEAVAATIAVAPAAVAWLIGAIGASIVGMTVGVPIVGAVKLIHQPNRQEVSQ